MKDCNKHVLTHVEEVAYKHLREEGCVFIRGRSGSGKTHLGDKLLERASREFSREMVKISSQKEWNLLPKSSHFDARPGLSVSDKYVVMIDDIFGSTNLIQYYVDGWKQKFDLVWPLVQSGKIWIVITSRPKIIFQVKQSLQRYDIIRQSSDVILDEGQYCFKEEEKFEFIDKLCGKYLNSLDRHRIAKTHTALGFPQCCTYFATHKQVQDRGWEFFDKPFECIKDEINCVMCAEPKTYFVLLMVLAYDGSLPKKDVQTINPPQLFKDRCTQMKRVSGLEDQPLPRKKEFEVLCGEYLTDAGTCFQFSHRSIQDVLCVDLCQSFPDLGTEISTPNMLVEYIRTRGQEEGQTEMVDLVVLDEEYHPILSKKLKEYLSNDRSRHIVLSHPSLNDMNILKEIFREWDVTGIKQLVEDDQYIFNINTTFHDIKELPFSEEFDMIPVLKSIFCRYGLSHIIINDMNEFAKYIVGKLSADTCDQFILDEALLCAVYKSQNDLVEMLLKHGAKPSQTCFDILTYSLDLSYSNCSKLTKLINPEMTDIQRLFFFALTNGNVAFLRNITEICTKYMADCKQFYTRCLQMITKIHTQMCDVSCKSGANSSGYKDKQIRLSKAVDAITFLLCAGGTIDLDRIVVLAISQHVPDTMTELLHNHFHIPYSVDNDLQGERGHSKKLHGLLRNVTKERVPGQTETLHALLHRAAWNQCQVCLNIFLSVCDVNVSDEDGNTALHYMAASDVEHCHDVLHILKEKATDGFKVNNEGQSPLHLAAINQCVDCVRLLLPSSDVLDQDNAGNTALHSLYRDVTSSRPCCDKIAELLIKEKADLHAKTKNKMGQTALHLATRKQCKECVRMLLTRSDINAQDEDGNTALHSVHDTSLKMIGSCDKHGCHNIYLVLVEEGAEVHSENKMRQTALHLAVRRQCEEGVRLLLPKSKVNAQDIDGNTALHHLTLASLDMLGSHSKEGCDEILQLLLQHEAKAHIANKSGKTALHFAAKRHLGKYVRTLLTCKSDVDAQDEGGNTALHCIHDAAFRRRCRGLCSEIYQLLIKEGASVNVENKRGETALHLAAGSQCREAVRLLLSRSDVNAQDKDGNTALHRIHVGKAVSCDQNVCHEISQLLITEGADVNIKNRNGEIALHVATRGLCIHGVRVLLVTDVTAKRAKTNVNAKDNDGNTALHCLHHGKHSLCFPSTCYGILKLLIEKDADVQLKNSRDRTPLHMAARLHCAKSVKLLVTLLDVNAQDEDGNTALHCLNINTLGLLNKGQTDINTIVCQISHQSEETTTVRPCRKCISMSTTKMDQQCQDDNSTCHCINDTLIHIAACAGPNSDCHDICRLLIENGSDVQIKNKSGHTALHFAERRQCREGVSMLLGKSDVDTQDEDGNTALHHIHGRTPRASFTNACVVSFPIEGREHYT
ncbi:uncharacterized protein LOC124116986 [Haliotis rufescens]|uniref:uncharacterized protein LOC124116986 n=1 Tax=Haliotis rufescens TaxID=6454 RepID=UPI00201F405D|nr:uncharacterized protein LOC124116986 [Haliotis rufescens]